MNSPRNPAFLRRTKEMMGKARLIRPTAGRNDPVEMTGDELQKLRKQLGVTGVEFARAFDVHERTMRAWETGSRDGKPVPVPRAVAILTRVALTDAKVRRELGFTKTKLAAE